MTSAPQELFAKEFIATPNHNAFTFRRMPDLAPSHNARLRSMVQELMQLPRRGYDRA
jgi:hypothetical protein